MLMLTRVNRGMESVDVGDSSTRFPGRSGRPSQDTYPDVEGRLVKGAMAALALAVFVATASAQGFRRGNRLFGSAPSAHTQRASTDRSTSVESCFRTTPPFTATPAPGGSTTRAPTSTYPSGCRELTKTRISRQPDGRAESSGDGIERPAMFNCPFIMMTEPGGRIGQTEAVHLREQPPQRRVSVGRRFLGH